MIELIGVAKSFGEVHAVQDVSVTIRNEVVGLLGPNGAGKTTTMRMITGYLAPDRGSVRVDGIDVAVDSLAARARIGYLPENAPLYLDMEVTDFLEYVARIRRMARGAIPPRIRTMVDQCGLGEVVGRPIGQLSKGYRQRVGLAAAMIHEPPILILDEPTSGLDPNQIVEIRALIRALGRQRTVVLSTHILQEVEATCDRAAIMHRGRLVGEGSIKELLQRRGAGVRYHLLVNAAEQAIRERAVGLTAARLERCARHHEEWQEAVFTSTKDGVAGEQLFDWVVANGWRLRELRKHEASLEDVFRHLTQEGT
ncbi:MAG: ATP-binding cassette domain-containing protein [Deltaproteobacteria bacterium]|nr:ATP-binding cassette domain-containing protein [Deltaproteobacteria bacterium]